MKPKEEVRRENEKEVKKKESDGVRKCRRKQTVSDVSHVLTAVHNHPVAFMNKLDAKCSLPLTSRHANAHTSTQADTL